MSVRRIHFRPPGVKTGSRVGPLGPFRGTLGIHWVIWSIVVGLLILFAVTWNLFRLGKPEEPFRSVGRLESYPPGSAREVRPGGVFVGRTQQGLVHVVAEPVNCPLEVTDRGYVDCLELAYRWDGQPYSKGEPLNRLPVQVYRDEVFIDPTDTG
ncbi:MAG: hypothetical protein ACRDI0_10445 [Actinomycetota bacterium]